MALERLQSFATACSAVAKGMRALGWYFLCKRRQEGGKYDETHTAALSTSKLCSATNDSMYTHIKLQLYALSACTRAHCVQLRLWITHWESYSKALRIRSVKMVLKQFRANTYCYALTTTLNKRLWCTLCVFYRLHCRRG